MIRLIKNYWDVIILSSYCFIGFLICWTYPNLYLFAFISVGAIILIYFILGKPEIKMKDDYKEELKGGTN